MDIDLDVISEKEVYPDPLFSTIMNAMNSMKEATADKIYQKIQREGPSNYSKPQVDRALASALRYGIFEVKNNQYRVRDDVLDDVDTVYWKMQRKREQTPFRLQEDIDERHYGPKLDPEKDNLRFQKITDPEATECPQCGRTKRPSQEKKEEKIAKTVGKTVAKTFAKNRAKSQNKEQLKRTKKKRKRRQRRRKFEAEESPEKLDNNEENRKLRCETISDDGYNTFRRMQGDNLNFPESNFPGKSFPASSKHDFNFENNYLQEKYETSDESEFDSVSFISDEESLAFNKDQTGAKKNKKRKTQFDSDCEEIEAPEYSGVHVRSNISIKSDSDSYRSDISYFSDHQSKSKLNGLFFENLPCTSTSTGNNNRTKQYKSYEEDCEAEKVEQCNRKSYWTGYSNNPQSAIIQTNNVLTIEPVDFLGFKGPEHTSYIL